jgi:hypothetical protein
MNSIMERTFTLDLGILSPGLINLCMESETVACLPLHTILKERFRQKGLVQVGYYQIWIWTAYYHNHV